MKTLVAIPKVKRIVDDIYAEFAEHPRYGRGPRLTGLNPNPSAGNVQLTTNSISQEELNAQLEVLGDCDWAENIAQSGVEESSRIPNTAIAADSSRQANATVFVTHYFDLQRRCRDCKRLFIFFAEEQKHWYEELGFGFDSDCVRCADCRRRQQGIARQKELYESLYHVTPKSPEQTLQMADACISLMESATFARRQTEHVRSLLNSLNQNTPEISVAAYDSLWQRLLVLESSE